jgi:hypothetical protein
MAERHVQIDIPGSLLKRFDQLNRELEDVLTGAEAIVKNPFSERVSFHVINSAPQDFVTDSERSALHSFILKCKSVPDFDHPQLLWTGKDFQLGNIDLAKHVITDWRPIIFNQTDAIYFTRIHNLIAHMMSQTDHSKGTKITVYAEKEKDVTSELLTFLGQCRDSVQYVIGKSDLDYLYNGVLQHSDVRFHERYTKEVHSGELNYVFLKNAKFMNWVKRSLTPYSWVAGSFWLPGHPKVGAL